MKKTIFFAVLFLPITLSLAPAADKNTLVIGLAADPMSLDPHDVNDTPSFNVWMNIFDTLLYRSRDLKVNPLLATSYKMIDDTTWEFDLRKGVRFHNGEEFNASTVKFNFDRLMNPSNKLKQGVGVFPEHFERIECIDDYKIRIITKHPLPFLDSILCYTPGIIPPQYLRDKGPSFIAANPVGSGPYKFVRWARDEQVVLAANEKYWRGVPQIKKVVFRPIPEATTRIAGLQNKELDIIIGVPPSHVPMAEKKGRSFVSKVPGMHVVFVAFDNTKGGPVADKRVRRAIAHAIDIDTIIKKTIYGYGIKLALPYPKTHFGYDTELKPYPYDPNEAKRLLAEAGYPKGFDFILNSPTGRWGEDRETAEAVVGYLRKVGINASARFLEGGTFITKWFSHDMYPAYLARFGDVTWDAGYALFRLLRSGSLFSNFHNPQIDALIDEGRSTTDRQKRLKAYYDVAKLIKEEVPYAFTYQFHYLYGINERVNWQGRLDEQMHVFDMSFKK
jgi:peptide/nickel transport system substrate-binding protein